MQSSSAADPTVLTPLQSPGDHALPYSSVLSDNRSGRRPPPPFDVERGDSPVVAEAPHWIRSSPMRVARSVADFVVRSVPRSPFSPRVMPSDPPWQPQTPLALDLGADNALIEPTDATTPQADDRYQLARIVSRVLLWVTYATLVVISCIAIYLLITENAQVQVWAWATALIFVNVAVPLSLYDIHGHMASYVRPQLQRYYIRILWMVPIYAIQSWLALYFQTDKTYIETPRDAYEAYVIYSFYNLMVEALGSRHDLAERLEQRGGIAPMLWPFCCVRWRLGYEFLTNTSVGVFQYVFLRLACTVITLITEFFDLYGDGSWSLQTAYTYVTITINFSQVWALYCLAGFYMQLRTEMVGLRPLGKFATVKAIVFFSWWQGVFISILLYAGVIQGTSSLTGVDISKGLEDFILCVEMAVFAVAHHYYFSYKDFNSDIVSGAARKQSMAQAVHDMLPVKDDLLQAVEIVKAALGLEHAGGRPSDASTEGYTLAADTEGGDDMALESLAGGGGSGGRRRSGRHRRRTSSAGRSASMSFSAPKVAAAIQSAGVLALRGIERAAQALRRSRSSTGASGRVDEHATVPAEIQGDAGTKTNDTVGDVSAAGGDAIAGEMTGSNDESRRRISSTGLPGGAGEAHIRTTDTAGVVVNVDDESSAGDSLLQGERGALATAEGTTQAPVDAIAVGVARPGNPRRAVSFAVTAPPFPRPAVPPIVHGAATHRRHGQSLLHDQPPVASTEAIGEHPDGTTVVHHGVPHSARRADSAGLSPRLLPPPQPHLMVPGQHDIGGSLAGSSEAEPQAANGRASPDCQ